MADPRIDALALALTRATAEQGVIRVAELDFRQLARAVAELDASKAAAASNPIDPEGDGLTPGEINAANDG